MDRTIHANFCCHHLMFFTIQFVRAMPFTLLFTGFAERVKSNWYAIAYVTQVIMNILIQSALHMIMQVLDYDIRPNYTSHNYIRSNCIEFAMRILKACIRHANTYAYICSSCTAYVRVIRNSCCISSWHVRLTQLLSLHNFMQIAMRILTACISHACAHSNLTSIVLMNRDLLPRGMHMWCKCYCRVLIWVVPSPHASCDAYTRSMHVRCKCSCKLHHVY